jgi:hypothetical protein
MKRALFAPVSAALVEDPPMLTNLVALLLVRRDAEDAGLEHDPASVTWEILPPSLPHLFDEDGAVLLDDAGVPVPAPWGLRVEYDA